MRTIELSVRNFLDAWTNRAKYGGDASTVSINIPAQLYYLQMAIYTGVSLIANAIGRCEFEVYEKNKKKKNMDYYLLNVAPNDNQTSSQFWHKVVSLMFTGEKGGAFIFEVGGKLFCSDDTWALSRESPLFGNLYEGIFVDGMQFERKFQAKDVCIIKLDTVNMEFRSVVKNFYSDYGAILTQAADAFKQTNGRKYKIHIEGVKPGDEAFDKYFTETLTKQLESYMKSSNAVYPEFEGYDLQPETGQTTKISDDFMKLRKELFDLVGSALKIPTSLMLGDGKNTTAITTFLTLCVDPVADVIAEALNKRAGFGNWTAGNRYQVNTSTVCHINMFDLSTSIDKLISSGFASIDEVRERVGMDQINEEWSRRHWMTKNYQHIEDLADDANGEKGVENEEYEDDVPDAE